MKKSTLKNVWFTVFVVLSTFSMAQAKVKLPEVGSKWIGYDTGLSGRGQVEVVKIEKASAQDVSIKLKGQLFQRQVDGMTFKRLISMPSNSFNGKVTIFTSSFKCANNQTGSISFEVLESHGIIVRFDYEACGYMHRLGYGTVQQSP